MTLASGQLARQDHAVAALDLAVDALNDAGHKGFVLFLGRPMVWEAAKHGRFLTHTSGGVGIFDMDLLTKMRSAPTRVTMSREAKRAILDVEVNSEFIHHVDEWRTGRWPQWR